MELVSLLVVPETIGEGAGNRIEHMGKLRGQHIAYIEKDMRSHLDRTYTSLVEQQKDARGCS